MGDLKAHGLSTTVPAGWDGRIARFREREVPAATVAHLASFRLPPERGDFGSGAVESMGPEDVLVCLVEFPGEEGSVLFSSQGVPRFRPTDFDPAVMQRTIAGMCGAQRFFTAAGRAFCAYVVLGRNRSIRPLVDQVNTTLASTQVGPARA